VSEAGTPHGMTTPRRRLSRVARGVIVLGIVLSGCRTAGPPEVGPQGVELEGMASWYGQEFAGRPTANGEIFDPETMTAAHRTLPFGTIIDVTNLKNGRTTRVRVNDRGPFVGNRIIDLSYAAARSLGMVEDGVSRVRLAIVRLGRGEREPPQPYAVKIDEEPSQPVPTTPEPPIVVEPTPLPEPVKTIDEEPVEVTEVPAETPAPQRPMEPVRAAPPPTPPPPPPSPAPTPRPVKGWKVQVGAFGVEANAVRLARELRSIVEPVFIEVVGGLHRVRIGPFASRVEAIEASERVQSAGYDAIVLSPDAR